MPAHLPDKVNFFLDVHNERGRVKANVDASGEGERGGGLTFAETVWTS